MAIPNYTRPLLEVFQQLDVTQQATGDRLAACVVGANYQLHRYGHEELVPTTFSATELLIPFAFEQDPKLDYKVDLTSVGVYAEGLEASLATFPSTTVVDAADIMTLRLNNGKMFASNDASKLDPLLKGMSVNIGDIVYVKGVAGDTPRRRTIVDVVGALSDSTTLPGEASVASTVNPITIGAAATADISPPVGSKFTGDKDTTYIIQCTKAPAAAGTFAGAEFKITDTSGVDFTQFLVVPTNNTAHVIGTKGLKLTFNVHNVASRLTVGDTFSFICVASYESTTDYNGIKLDSMPVDAATFNKAVAVNSVELRKKYSGKLPSDDAPDAAWTVTDAGVRMAPGASIYLPDRATAKYVPFVTSVGSVLVEFRVQIIPDIEEDLYELSNNSDIEAAFGTIAQANDIAYACHTALLGSFGRTIYALRVRGTDVDGFKEALKKTESTIATYSFVALSNNIEVQDAVVSFNAEMSAPDVKKWRRTIIGVDSPGEYAATSVDRNFKILKATFNADELGAFTLVQIPEDLNFSFEEVPVHGITGKLHKGDKIQLMSNGVKYVIKAVLSSREVLLETGPRTKVSPAMPITIWKANTPANTAEYVTSVAKRFNTRRALVVWCDGGSAEKMLTASEVVSNKFIAAELAGLSSSILPNKSITHTELQSITKSPRMYTQYTQLMLDKIAAEGVLIVTQDTRNTACYVRHQLTTETNKGNLYYEDSCTRNVDNISYQVAAKLEGYIGKANVTPSALRHIDTNMRIVLTNFTADSVDELIGPSLVRWYDLSIVQDPVFQDRVILRFKMDVPLPLNNIKTYEMAFVAAVAI